MIMEFVFGVALLVLAAGVVLLFAMVAELASRVPDPRASGRSPALRPLPEARLGRVASRWPGGLAPLADRQDVLLLVLSTACGSCRDVAEQLRAADPTELAEIGVVVSCGTAEAGDDFVLSQGLTAFPHLVDVDGGWVSQEFDVRVSPTGLILRDGRLESALLFSDVAALRAAEVSGRSRQTPHRDDPFREDPLRDDPFREDPFREDKEVRR